jgi:hypothetical protein
LSYQFEKTLNFEFHLSGPKLGGITFQTYISNTTLPMVCPSALITKLLISAHDTTISIKIVP